MMDLTIRSLSPICLVLLLLDIFCPKNIETSYIADLNGTNEFITVNQIPSTASLLTSGLNLGSSNDGAGHNSYLSTEILNLSSTKDRIEDEHHSLKIFPEQPKCSSYSIINYSKEQKCISKKFRTVNNTASNKKNNCERPLSFYNTTNQTKSSNHDLILSNIDVEKQLIKSSQTDGSFNGTENINVVSDIMLMKSSQTTNDMLSFEEWRKKISEQNDRKRELEVETKKVNDEIVQRSMIGTEQNLKLSTNRARNFASHECGAKILSSNHEANYLDKVLTELTDEYMLNPCKYKNWLVMELCETIQPQYLEIANFELYSSIPKEFSVYASDEYPNRNEWSLIGNFTASDIREIQGFKLQSNDFVKYLKIEILTYYGQQHFCPISVIRIFGTSLFDEVERIDKFQAKMENFEESNGNAVYEGSLEKPSTKMNIIGNAKNAVMNMVKKAFNFTIFNEILWNFSFSKETPEIINTTWQTKVMKFYEKFEVLIAQCSNCELIYSTNSSLNIQKCQFLRVILSCLMYDVLFTQYFLNRYLHINFLFQCPNNETALNLNNFNLIDFKLKNNDSFIINNFSCKFADSLVRSKQLSIDNLNDSKVLQTIVSSVTATDSIRNLTIEPSIILPVLQNAAKTIPLQTASLTILKDWTTNEDIANLIPSSVVPVEVKTDSISIPSISFDLESMENQNGFSSNSGQSKEAVIIRLTSKIKNLEKNISLMSTYLESLSVRYKIQMEEMQLIFNKTIDHLNNTAIRAAEKDTKQQELLMALELEITKLKIKLMNLSTTFESNNFNYIQIHILLMVVEVFLIIIVCLVIYRRVSFRSSINISRTNSCEHKPKDPLLDKAWKHHRSKSMPSIPFESTLNDCQQKQQQNQNVTINSKVRTLITNETDCDIEKENQLINIGDDRNVRDGNALCLNDSKSTPSCVENILKIIN